MNNPGTHIDLYVEILQVESVLPDINADDGGEREERILVSRGGNLELFGGMVITLMIPNQSGHEMTASWRATHKPTPT